MGLRLTVREVQWRRAVSAAAAELPGLIPVIKGNGYGFGRAALIPIAREMSPRIAVGTVFEAHDVRDASEVLVLTPSLDPVPVSVPRTAVLTVGRLEHVAALARSGWSGSVAVKLQSRLRRFGVEPAELQTISNAIADIGASTVMYSIHLDLVADSAAHLDEVTAWLPHLDPLIPVSVSHLDATTYQQLRAEHSDRELNLRVGTALWHAGKPALQLSADVLEVRAARAGETFGYRATPAPANGAVAVVAAGSAHGVRALDDGRSPFHFARQRLEMLEPPHMHTSMLFVASGQACPAVGDRVDVQRPLITTLVDEVEWIDA